MSQKTSLETNLEQLKSSNENLSQIAAYCRQFYSRPDLPTNEYNQALDQTKTYVLQAVSSVAYLMEQASLSLHEQLSMQLASLDEDIVKINEIGSKLSASQESIAKQASSDQKPLRLSEHKPKIRKIPRSVNMIIPTPHKKINLNELDDVGVSMASSVDSSSVDKFKHDIKKNIQSPTSPTSLTSIVSSTSNSQITAAILPGLLPIRPGAPRTAVPAGFYSRANRVSDSTNSVAIPVVPSPPTIPVLPVLKKVSQINTDNPDTVTAKSSEIENSNKESLKKSLDSLQQLKKADSQQSLKKSSSTINPVELSKTDDSMKYARKSNDSLANIPPFDPTPAPIPNISKAKIVSNLSLERLNRENTASSIGDSSPISQTQLSYRSNTQEGTMNQTESSSNSIDASKSVKHFTPSIAMRVPLPPSTTAAPGIPKVISVPGAHPVLSNIPAPPSVRPGPVPVNIPKIPLAVSNIPPPQTKIPPPPATVPSLPVVSGSIPVPVRNIVPPPPPPTGSSSFSSLPSIARPLNPPNPTSLPPPLGISPSTVPPSVTGGSQSIGSLNNTFPGLPNAFFPIPLPTSSSGLPPPVSGGFPQAPPRIANIGSFPARTVDIPPPSVGMFNPAISSNVPKNVIPANIAVPLPGFPSLSEPVAPPPQAVLSAPPVNLPPPTNIPSVHAKIQNYPMTIAPPPISSLAPPVNISPPTNIVPPGSAQYVKALHPFQATAGDEISIVPGDILRLVGPDLQDGWLEGYNEAKKTQGLFPASYVTKI